jgi:hypothetical protein
LQSLAVAREQPLSEVTANGGQLAHLDIHQWLLFAFGSHSLRLFLLRTLILSLLFISILAACRDEYNQTVIVEEGRHVQMSLTGLLSFQYDWDRYLTISDSDKKIRVALMSDTGWWRGSSLYRYKSGAYVLNEGQGGCIFFQCYTLEALQGYSHLCDRMPTAERQSALNITSESCTPSRHYSDLCFLGLFFEAEDLEPALQFNWSATQDEPLLPEPP